MSHLIFLQSSNCSYQLHRVAFFRESLAFALAVAPDKAFRTMLGMPIPDVLFYFLQVLSILLCTPAANSEIVHVPYDAALQTHRIVHHAFPPIRSANHSGQTLNSDPQ
jgi:hypothetical protein